MEFDEDQRRIFEESLTCRKARLNNTLRTIKRCLQSEPYRRAEHDFESEISRIERATKAEREGLEEMEERFEREIFARFEAKFDDFEREREDIEERRANLEEESKDLETRYFNKRREFDQEEADISRSIREHSDLGESSEGVRTKFRVRKAQIGTESESIKNAITRIRGEIKGLPEAFKQLEIQAKGRFEKDRGKLEEEETGLESEIDNFGEYAKEEERNLELEFEEFRKQTIERINKRDSKGDSELSKRIESVLKAGRISSDYGERQNTYKRYKAYLELARSRAWEK